jgi:hypothetical protein
MLDFFYFKEQSSNDPSDQSIEHKAQRIKMVSPAANYSNCASPCSKPNKVLNKVRKQKRHFQVLTECVKTRKCHL